MWYSLSVTCDRSVVFSGYSGYDWNIVESGVKRRNPKHNNNDIYVKNTIYRFNK